MKTIIYILTIVMVLKSGILKSQQVSISEIEGKLDTQIEKLIQETGIPSVSIALFNSDLVLMSKAYGYSNVALKVKATPKTIYHTGSTFKTVTATAVMQLSDSGLIYLGSPVNNYLKRVSVDNSLDCNCDITLRHLLSHQAGLKGNTELINLWERKELKSLDSIAKETKQIKEPGKEFEYCNHCYVISALALEDVLNTSFGSYINRNLLSPLEININPFTPTPRMMEMMAMPYKLENNKAQPENFVRFDVYPAGDVYMNPTLFAKILIPQINNGKYQNTKLLNKSSIQDMQSKQFENENYGLGLFLGNLDSHKTISHGGTLPGFTSYFLIDINTKVGVYIMANAGEIRPILEELSKYTIRLMNGNANLKELPSFKKKEAIEVSESILQTYVGKYEVATNVFADVTREGNNLFIQITGQPKFDLFAYEETKFSLKVMDAQIEFTKDEKGQVNGLFLYQGENKVPGKRVD
jgi:serine-type D-Ala-D-Ala carboxypeptidase/endopeptidase